MRVKTLFVAVLTAMLVAGLIGSTGLAAAPAEKADYLIGFRMAPGSGEHAVVRGLGGEIYGEFSIVNVIAATMTPQAAYALTRNPGVAYVELDAPVYALEQTVPWGIDRVFGDESYSFETWGVTAGDGVAVAIIDSGIDENHQDLPQLLGGVNTIDDTHWGYDGSGHGTHVAGTVAALDNTWGVVGVSPQVDLYAVKVLDANGSGTVASVVGGIDWAVQQGIPIMNMSLGTSSHVQALQDACDAAYAVGYLIVSSAGNSGNPPGRGDNVGYPARYESVIAVAASTISDTRASYSSTGPAVELIAPGSSVVSTLPGDNYGFYSGTSMASPHVTGVAALVLAAQPGLTNVQIRTILQETAEDLGLSSNYQGYGMVRADLAVAAAGGEPPPPPQEYDLTTSSTAGGLVTAPGEGTFTYEEGTMVDLLAVAETGYQFVNWTGDTGTIVNSASTTIAMNGDYSVTATFEEAPVGAGVSVKSVTYSTSGGRFSDKHLAVTLLLVDDMDNPVAGASVSATLHHEGGGSWNFAGTTGSDGTVVFSLNNHGSGCYWTQVTAVVADGLDWDGVTPENGYCK